MRKIGLLGVAAALLFFAALSPASASSPPIGAFYESVGPAGDLSLANAQGLHFTATNLEGMVVADGVAPLPMYTVPVVTLGAPAIIVHIGGVCLTVNSGEWEWDGGTW